MEVISLFLAIWLSSCDSTIAVNKNDNKQPLHIKSLEWGDQIAYFVMLDRFQVGDSDNSDQEFNLYRLKHPYCFNGVDIQGSIDRVDYIKDLGVTAVWLTPPNANL
ncbi:MAG: hypothetical protein L3J46_01330 [Kangiellaceae bacterium]|nr:hypothetical protein [Kangiellaceae bacterium]